MANTENKATSALPFVLGSVLSVACALGGMFLLAQSHKDWWDKNWHDLAAGALLLLAVFVPVAGVLSKEIPGKRESARAIPPVTHGQNNQPIHARILDASKWVDGEIAFYTTYGLRQNVWYRVCRIPVVVFASAIPVVALSRQNGSAEASAILGALVAILEAVAGSFRFRDNWLTSIAARDRLLLEGRLFAAAAGPYAVKDDEKRCSLFVERAVGHVQTESEDWRKIQLLDALEQQALTRDATKPLGNKKD